MPRYPTTSADRRGPSRPPQPPPPPATSSSRPPSSSATRPSHHSNPVTHHRPDPPIPSSSTHRHPPPPPPPPPHQQHHAQAQQRYSDPSYYSSHPDTSLSSSSDPSHSPPSHSIDFAPSHHHSSSSSSHSRRRSRHPHHSNHHPSSSTPSSSRSTSSSSSSHPSRRLGCSLSRSMAVLAAVLFILAVAWLHSPVLLSTSFFSSRPTVIKHAKGEVAALGSVLAPQPTPLHVESRSEEVTEQEQHVTEEEERDETPTPLSEEKQSSDGAETGGAEKTEDAVGVAAEQEKQRLDEKQRLEEMEKKKQAEAERAKPVEPTPAPTPPPTPTPSSPPSTDAHPSPATPITPPAPLTNRPSPSSTPPTPSLPSADPPLTPPAPVQTQTPPSPPPPTSLPTPSSPSSLPLYSSFHCIGDRGRVNTHKDRSCHFQHLCYDPTFAQWQFYVNNDSLPITALDLSLIHTTFPTSFIDLTPSSGGKDAQYFAPTPVHSPIPPSAIRHPSTHLLYYPHYAANLLRVLADDYFALMNLQLSFDRLSYDNRLLVASDCEGMFSSAPRKRGRCEEIVKEVKGGLVRSEPVSVHPGLAKEGGVGVQCFEHVLAGVGPLGFGQGLGRGPLWWRQRVWMLTNWGMQPLHTPTKQRVSVSVTQGERALYNQKEVVEHLTAAFPSVEVEGVELSGLGGLQEQVKYVMDTTVLVTLSGESAAPALFMAGGCVVMVNSWDVNAQNVAEGDDRLWSNLGWLNVMYYQFVESEVMLEGEGRSRSSAVDMREYGRVKVDLKRMEVLVRACIAHADSFMIKGQA